MVFENLHSRRTFLRRTALATAFVTVLPELIAKAAPQADDASAPRKKMILFQGDSITDCGRSRTPNTGAPMGQGYPVLVSSRLMADFPQLNLRCLNRGISGHKITDLAARWQTDTLDLNPDYLSILVGINDVFNFINGNPAFSADKYYSDYKDLLDKTIAKNPSVKLILCEPFLLLSENQKKTITRHIGELQKRQEIVRKLVAEYNATFVAIQEPLTEACKNAPAEYWSADAVHPTFAGHEIIAREWIKATKTLFKS